MSPFLKQVEQSIRTRRLLPREQPILVAVSGGVDSMVLLRVLHELASKYHWRLAVAHLNHQLRGSSSDADERLVRNIAASLKLPISVEQADVREFARSEKLSIEMGARKLRHDFLARVAARLKIERVVLAHHADDQIELFLLRLLRGSGSEALAGMRWRNPSPSAPEIELVRPLLDQSKSALLRYAMEAKVRFREDRSNASRDIQRNWIRHELLPLLRKYQPALSTIVLRAAEIIGAEGEFVGNVATTWLEPRQGRKRARAKGPISELNLEHSKFDQLPVAVQRRCIHFQLLELGGAPDFDSIEALRLKANQPVCVSRATAGPVQELEQTTVPFSVIREPSGILRLVEVPSGQFLNTVLDVDLNEHAGEAVFDGVKVQWKVEAKRGGWQSGHIFGQEYFDAEAVGRAVRLRHWRAGDRFQPLGMPQPVKLQDFFVNQKIPRALRHELVLATTAEGEIFWVENQRISERFKLTKTTIRRLQWGWQRI